MYGTSTLDEILLHGNGEESMSCIDIMSSQSQTRGYFLDAPTSIGQCGLSAITRKAIITPTTASSSGISFSRCSADKLADPLLFVRGIKISKVKNIGVRIVMYFRSSLPQSQCLEYAVPIKRNSNSDWKNTLTWSLHHLVPLRIRRYWRLHFLPG